MKKINYLLEYALVRAAEACFRILPRRWAFSGGEKLGIGLSRVIGKRNNLILENLSHAFPEKSGEEKARIARAVWKNIGRTAVEFVRIAELVTSNAERFVTYEGAEHVERALKSGTGVILLTSHFSNWELTGIASQLAFRNVMAIARPMKNPFVEKWVQRRRAAGGMQIILHRQAVRASLKWLKEKKIVGLLVDQNLYTGGVFVDFFGRPAATTTLPALLHIRTGAPVITSYSLREGDKFRVVYEPPVKFPEMADGEARVRAYTQIVNERLEAVIRKYPENWFWIHNRWKRKPDVQP